MEYLGSLVAAAISGLVAWTVGYFTGRWREQKRRRASEEYWRQRRSNW
jgi:uncharacterized protein (DUF2062 family)